MFSLNGLYTEQLRLVQPDSLCVMFDRVCQVAVPFSGCPTWLCLLRGQSLISTVALLPLPAFDALTLRLYDRPSVLCTVGWASGRASGP